VSLFLVPRTSGRRSCARVSKERSDGRDILGARPGSFINTSADRTTESGDVQREMLARTPCRKRPRAATQPRRAEAETEATSLQDALRKIRQLREERQQEQESFEMRLRQREEELRRLE